ncbi:MBOAT family O-acyltransferase [Winogradskyella psychrotolerans]|uniref:MBOAT family O-acyltransferase n=1 Tax=Winogradskyella psychrotolerans TaxID=1344585 RepID=UPI001C068503|nr:MBOAT family O-acyltransferase [Winogradskyella psychrotolerans]MBU2929546.1 MBOAT family protein [Winogradskyella psychrotolerans]
MLFNSIDFAVFLPIVFGIYWFIVSKKLKLQNLFIVLASYVFYGWWDWRFLALIAFSTAIDYAVGVALSKQKERTTRKVLLWISIVVNLGFLGFFKYYNFFLDNFVSAFSFFGKNIQANSLNIILPVGISFYTFQTLSYTIDVYKRKLEPTKDFIVFAAFVSFFPQLVAGPIERATNLLPQFYVKRQFNASLAKDGLRQMVWGLFKKIVIADNCAQFANDIFSNYDDYSSSTLWLGAVYFAFQIYGDFSGYSDIAIGTSKLFGFNLKQNFATPYFSRDIAEFWRRWHISLSTWFRDYLYIPLGGSRGKKIIQLRNVFVIFIVSGFWHGANWTFIVWGTLNALFFLPLLLTNKNRKHTNVVAENHTIPTLRETLQMIITFVLTVFAWIFFRAESVEKALLYIKGIFEFSVQLEDRLTLNRYAFELLPLIGILIIIEWFSRQKEHPIKTNAYSTLYMIFILLLIILFGSFSNIQEFIYFQF